MISLNVQQLLQEKNRSRYWLVKQMQTSYGSVNKYCDNTSTSLELETIEKLCAVLECEPNDLFVIE